ncbi:MAG: hypothetical protein JSR80_05655 [Verrucomicrobia bacterium]|nr:hypothetical protein [Verrucomicrobiota bacterium]
MPISPCSNSCKCSSWDLLAIGSVGFGLTSLFLSKVYRPQWYTQYAPHLVASTITTSGGSLLCKWIINHDPHAWVDKTNAEKLEQWKQIRLETEGHIKKYFLERCTTAQLANILIEFPTDFCIIRDEILVQHLSDALNEIVSSKRLALFWSPLRGVDKMTPPSEMCQSVFKLMSPESAAKLLDLSPSDVDSLISLRRHDSLKVVRFLETAAAMQRWIQRKQTKDLSQKQIEELYEAMRPPLPTDKSATCWETWHPQPTEAFKRFISESHQFNAMAVIKDSKTLLVFMKILGKDFSMEYLTDSNVIQKITNLEATPLTKVVKKKAAKDVDDDDVRIRGIYGFFKHFQFEDTLAAHAYLQMAKTYWPRATLLALDDLSKLAVLHTKEAALKEMVKSIYPQFAEEVSQSPTSLMELLFDKKVPPSHLPGLARTLTRLGINFEGLSLLRDSILNKLLETNDKDLPLVLKNFVFLLSEKHQQAFITDLQKEGGLVGKWSELFDKEGFSFHPLDKKSVEKFLKKITEEDGSITSLILKYFQRLENLESFENHLLKRVLKPSEEAEGILHKYMKDFLLDVEITKPINFEKVLHYAATLKSIKDAQIKKPDIVPFGEWHN